MLGFALSVALILWSYVLRGYYKTPLWLFQLRTVGLLVAAIAEFITLLGYLYEGRNFANNPWMWNMIAVCITEFSMAIQAFISTKESRKEAFKAEAIGLLLLAWLMLLEGFAIQICCMIGFAALVHIKSTSEETEGSTVWAKICGSFLYMAAAEILVRGLLWSLPQDDIWRISGTISGGIFLFSLASNSLFLSFFRLFSRISTVAGGSSQLDRRRKVYIILLVCLIFSVLLVSGYSLVLIFQALGNSKTAPRHPPLPDSKREAYLHTFLPTLIDTRTQVPRGQAVCLVTHAFMEVGGIETWTWHLINEILRGPEFYLHSLRTYLAHPVAIMRLLDIGAQFNPPMASMEDECDIILHTGLETAPPAPRYSRRVPRILVIHGGNDDYTKNYVKYAAIYDEVVGVSRGSIDVLRKFPGQEGRGKPIPFSSQPIELPTAEKRLELRANYSIPEGHRVLLFLARMSSEKRPEMFFEVLNQLPPGWIGLVPSYCTWHGLIPDRMPGNIVLAPGMLTSDALAIADAMYLPSLNEGGPIALLECWGARVPVFMHPVGLATSHPDGVFLVDQEESAADIASRIVNVIDRSGVDTKSGKSLERVLEYGETYINEHKQTMSQSWLELIRWLLRPNCKRLDVPLLIEPMMSSSHISITGRSRIIFAANPDPLSVARFRLPLSNAFFFTCPSEWNHVLDFDVEVDLTILDDGVNSFVPVPPGRLQSEIYVQSSRGDVALTIGSYTFPFLEGPPRRTFLFSIHLASGHTILDMIIQIPGTSQLKIHSVHLRPK